MHFIATFVNLRIALGMLLLVLLTLQNGCRKAPATTPKYYEAEIRAMKKEEALAEIQKNQKFLKDGYPWEGKTKSSDCLPCRISEVEKPMKAEIDFLHTFIHGKKQTKPRLRD